MITLTKPYKHIIRISESQCKRLQKLNEINYVATKSNITVCSLQNNYALL